MRAYASQTPLAKSVALRSVSVVAMSASRVPRVLELLQTNVLRCGRICTGYRVIAEQLNLVLVLIIGKGIWFQKLLRDSRWR